MRVKETAPGFSLRPILTFDTLNLENVINSQNSPLFEALSYWSSNLFNPSSSFSSEDRFFDIYMQNKDGAEVPNLWYVWACASYIRETIDKGSYSKKDILKVKKILKSAAEKRDLPGKEHLLTLSSNAKTLFEIAKYVYLK